MFQRVLHIIPDFEKSASAIDADTGECSVVNPDITQFGSLKVTMLYKGDPAKQVEVDIAKTPGPDNYCYQMTDDQGIAEFQSVPVGSYYIYLNMTNFPSEYGIPSAEKQITITQGISTETIIELTDYQK